MNELLLSKKLYVKDVYVIERAGTYTIGIEGTKFHKTNIKKKDLMEEIMFMSVSNKLDK